KSLVLLALALGCGLIASIGISQVLDSSNKPAPVETVPIYVALQNINLGDPISEALVSLEEWPKDKVPAGAITRWEDIEERRPRATVFQGEPLLDSKLLAKGQISDPIQGVPPGMRLKTISVDARKSAAGLLSPGNRVDVQIFGRRHTSGGVEVPFTKIFLQNIRVFAVDQEISRSADGTEARTVAKTVSLVVTPAQANRITLAENLGEVSLIPRNPDDEHIVDDEIQDIDDLLNPSTANSRAKESVAVEEPEAENPLKSMIGSLAPAAMAQTSVKPEFKMTIIYPNDVEQIRFSNGEPVVEKGGASPPTPVMPPFTMEAPKGEKLDGPEDFPIDLNQK
ncbi:MAG: Flp pilus assembly protein CpaB, partial [Planctomycetales bacterium]|nr:Flp pilus assembly protein CpaB [Planctomycetales bacterium]